MRDVAFGLCLVAMAVGTVLMVRGMFRLWEIRREAQRRLRDYSDDDLARLIAFSERVLATSDTDRFGRKVLRDVHRSYLREQARRSEAPRSPGDDGFGL